MKLLTLDIESYYAKDYTLSKLSTEEYVNDHRFEAIGLAVSVDGEEPQWFSGTHAETRAWLEQFDIENNAVLAHNAMFDCAILAFQFSLYPKVIFDTLSMGRALHGLTVGNSLDKLTKYYGVGEKGTEVHNFIGYTRAAFSPSALQAYAEYCKQDVRLTYKLFEKMMMRFSKSELTLIDMTIRMFTEPQFMADAQILETHLADVRLKQADMLAALNITKEDTRSDAKFADLLRSLGVEPPTKISAKTGKEAYAFAKTDEGLKELANHPDHQVQMAVAARLGTKSTIEETRTERLIQTQARNTGFLPIQLSYYGARTGRWSAAGATNFQNIPRTSPIKKGVIAPPGHVIVQADLSNIELRVGLWVAGQMDKLQKLQDGVDLYKDFASSVFGVAYDAVTKEQRFVGKTSQLSLIYGVGAAKLRAALKQGSGVDIGETEAKRIVDMYRTEYSSVAASWRKGNDVLEAIRDDMVMTFGYNEIIPVHGTSGMLLPSGMYLGYPGLRYVASHENGKNEWKYDRTPKLEDRVYGAKVYQSAIQSLARCVMGEAMVRINKVYRVGLTVHDALYLAAPTYIAKDVLEFVIDEMTTTPEWLPGIVLGAEGSIGNSLKE